MKAGKSRVRFAMIAFVAVLFPTLLRAEPKLDVQLAARWPNYARGTALAVQVEGSIAYVAQSTGGMQLYDIANPTNPIPVGSFPTTGPALGLHVKGNLAFVACDQGGLEIVDVSQPAKPSLVGHYDTPGQAENVFVIGGIAYVADRFWGLHLLNVREPEKPIFLSTILYARQVIDVKVVGSLAYVLAQQDGLVILDVSNPTNVIRRGTAYLPTLTRAMEVADNYAYVTAHQSGTWVVDVSNPLQPSIMHAQHAHGEAGDLFLSANTLWVADPEEGLVAYDVTIRTNLVRLASVDTPGSASGVFVTNALAYVADGGLRIFDVSLPQAMEAGGYATPSDAVAVTAAGTTVYVGDLERVHVLNASSPTNPVIISQLPVGNATDIVPAGKNVYVASPQSGVSIFQPSLVGASQLLGRWTTNGTANDLTVWQNGWTWVAYGESGLHLLDTTSPTNIVRLGGYDTAGEALGITINDRIYVADGSNGLEVLTYSSVSNVVRLGGFDTDGVAHTAEVVGSHAYVADGLNGLVILDVSTPANIKRVGWYNTAGEAQAVRVLGHRAYVSDGSSGMVVMDISNPTSPRLLYTWPTMGPAHDLDIGGGFAYAASADGLEVIDVTVAPNIPHLGSFAIDGSAGRVSISGERIYLGDGPNGLQIFTINDRQEATRLGGYSQGREYLKDFKPQGNLLFTCVTPFGLRILDVSDPGRVQAVGSYSNRFSGWSIDVLAETAYFGTFGNGLHILDISDPANISVKGIWASDFMIEDVLVVGNRAYVAAGTQGLHILDVSNPTNVVTLGTFRTTAFATCVQVSSNTLYLVEWPGGLHILDISEPANVRKIGGFTNAVSTGRIQVIGDLVYVSMAQNGLRLIDVRNPQNLLWLGGYDTVGYAADVQVVGNRVYVADGVAGLAVFNVKPSLDMQTSERGTLQMTLWSQGTGSARVEESTNLIEWTPVATNLVTEPSVSISVPAKARQFIRARVDF